MGYTRDTLQVTGVLAFLSPVTYCCKLQEILRDHFPATRVTQGTEEADNSVLLCARYIGVETSINKNENRDRITPKRRVKTASDQRLSDFSFSGKVMSLFSFG